ncbi:MAG: DUF1385 domain-containing protein [Clostridia bacterium]|nr:DUF1385 domain-containing protein [Clostridia bacterium]
MSKDNCNVCKKTSIGGQALIEGIMMKGPERTYIAVRNGQKEIVGEDVKFPNPAKKCKILGWPIIRGVANFAVTMYVGMKTLMRSADLSGMTELEEEMEAEKKEKKLRKKAEKKGVSYEELKAKEDAKPKKLSNAVLGVIMTIGTVLGTGLALVLFMWLPTFLFNLLSDAVPFDIANWRAFFEGILKIAIFVGYILLVSQMSDIKRLFQYHGAEHKTIFCYEKGLDLTVENVREQLRFHPRCGTSFMFLMIAVGIIFSTIIVIFAPQVTKMTALWVAIKILLVPLFCGVGYELIKFCGKHDNFLTKIIAAPGLWVQRITTKEPDDDMIEVAIEAMKQVIPDNPELDKI